MFMNLLSTKKKKPGRLTQNKNSEFKPQKFMASDHICSFILEDRVKHKIESLENCNDALRKEMDSMKLQIKALNEKKYKEIDSAKKYTRIVLAKFV